MGFYDSIDLAWILEILVIFVNRRGFLRFLWFGVECCDYCDLAWILFDSIELALIL